MNALDQLRQNLNGAVRDALSKDNWGDPAAMHKVAREIQKSFGRLSDGFANERSIATAVLDYRNSGQLPTFRDTKYVCLGIGSLVGQDKFRLIEDTQLFPRLLGRVDSFHEEPRKFRRCYQGLLLGYFEYPGRLTDNQSGRKNWGLLRNYLSDGLKPVTRESQLPPWAQTLREHANLLSDDPCQRYGQAMLSGEREDFDAMCEGLALSDRAWVYEEIILSQIGAAANKNDLAFISHINALLEVLDEHDALKDRGLELFLSRYLKCQNAREHLELRGAAVRRWGNPWLKQSETAWLSWVKEPVRQMVAQWLKLRCIEDFFSLLQSDGAADPRRLNFWLRYVDHIHDMYFALGRDAIFSRSDDYKRIRLDMKGRLMQLDSIQAGNNAFLMCIGDYAFVEFGQKNNACHVFRMASLMPFTLGQGSVSDTKMHLKNDAHRSHAKTLRHIDGHEQWEVKFAREIYELTKAKPSGSASGSRRAVSRVSAVQSQSSEQASTQVSWKRLAHLASESRLKIEDRRSKNGNLWVRTDDQNPEINRTLKEWGFTYSPGKGWWKE